MSAKLFPILLTDTERKHFVAWGGAPTGVPWDLVLAHEAQCLSNHDQTVQRLAERGGLSTEELCCVLMDKRWRERPAVDPSVDWYSSEARRGPAIGPLPSWLLLAELLGKENL